MNTTIRPSRWMYLIPVGIFLLGIIIAIILIARLGTKVLDANVFTVGNSTTITAEAGDKMLLGISNYDNTNVAVTSSTTITQITIETGTFDIEHDDSISMTKIRDNTELNIMEYNMIVSMEFEEAGTYILSTDSDDSLPSNIELMILPMNIQSMFINVFGALGAVGISFVIGLISGIIIKVKRNKSKRHTRTVQHEPQNNQRTTVETNNTYYE